MTKWYVHYEIRYEDAPAGHDTGSQLVLGPYTEDEAITKRREMEKMNGVTEAHLSQLPAYDCLERFAKDH